METDIVWISLKSIWKTRTKIKHIEIWWYIKLIIYIIYIRRAKYKWQYTFMWLYKMQIYLYYLKFGATRFYYQTYSPNIFFNSQYPICFSYMMMTWTWYVSRKINCLRHICSLVRGIESIPFPSLTTKMLIYIQRFLVLLTWPSCWANS